MLRYAIRGWRSLTRQFRLFRSATNSIHKRIRYVALRSGLRQFFKRACLRGAICIKFRRVSIGLALKHQCAHQRKAASLLAWKLKTIADRPKRYGIMHVELHVLMHKAVWK